MRALTRAVAVLLVVLTGEALAYEPVFDRHLDRPTSVVFNERRLLDRRHEYGSDYFQSVLTYRPRYPLRVLTRLASTHYRLTVGSTTNNEFFLEQGARIRMPFTSWLLGEFQFIQAEDYDDRFLRATGEVSVLVPGTAPSFPVLPLSLVGETPPPWGLFFGASTELNAFKEFADVGFHAGYRVRHLGVRGDVLLPEAFFNAKNRSGGEIDSKPVAYRLEAELAPSLEGPYLSAWGEYQERVAGSFPDEDLRRGAYELARGGVEAVVFLDRRFAVDVDFFGESARKTRRFVTRPELDDDFRREAAQLYVECDMYLGPPEEDEAMAHRPPIDAELADPWGQRPAEARGGLGPELSRRGWVVPRDVLARSTPADWSRTDVFELGGFGQLLREAAIPRGGRAPGLVRTRRLERREGYVYVAYVLTTPSIVRGLAFRPLLSVGYLREREVQRDVSMRVDRKDDVLVRAAFDLEWRFRDGAAVVVNLTYRIDDPEFGGGNVQVVYRF